MFLIRIYLVRFIIGGVTVGYEAPIPVREDYFKLTTLFSVMEKVIYKMKSKLSPFYGNLISCPSAELSSSYTGHNSSLHSTSAKFSKSQ